MPKLKQLDAQYEASLYDKVRNHLNSHTFPRNYEANTQPSLTVPDQTMTIREILVRYARGLPISGNVPIYEGEDNDLPDPRTMDLAERADFAEQVQEEIIRLRTPKAKVTPAFVDTLDNTNAN